MTQTDRFVRAALVVAAVLASAALWWPAPAEAARIKDVASIQGVRDNQLIGYGLVVGLDGTGDQTTQAPFTTQTLLDLAAADGRDGAEQLEHPAEERRRRDGDGAAAGLRAARRRRSTSPSRRSATPRACAAAR